MILRILLGCIVFGFLGYAIYCLLNFCFGKSNVKFDGKHGRITKAIDKKVESINSTTVNIVLAIIFIVSFLILLARV